MKIIKITQNNINPYAANELALKKYNSGLYLPDIYLPEEEKIEMSKIGQKTYINFPNKSVGKFVWLFQDRESKKLGLAIIKRAKIKLNIEHPKTPSDMQDRMILDYFKHNDKSGNPSVK